MTPAQFVNSLMTRVLEYVGPRQMPTGTDYASGRDRQVAIPQVSQTRWLLEDLEWAILAADSGQLKIPARMVKAIMRDGVARGVMSTRTDGLVQLPLTFAGDPAMIAALQGDFREVFPSAELALLASDGISLGVAVGEFVEIPGAKPVLRRLDPEFLWYLWSEDRWYYQSIHGMLPINPGDGRWVLHCPGGSINPWTHGLWMANGRAYIAKEHAFFHRENFSSKLANAARVAVAPQAATQAEAQDWFQKVMAWGVNTVFGLKPGYDVKLLESNGRGYEVFKETIATSNEEFMVTIAGQIVTTTGGAGFTNANLFGTIRYDLIQSDADRLAATLNVQGIPVLLDWRFGASAGRAACSWDTTPPKDLGQTADALTKMAAAIKAWNEAAANYGQQVKLADVARRFDVPLEQLAQRVRPANDNAAAAVRARLAA